LGSIFRELVGAEELGETRGIDEDDSFRSPDSGISCGDGDAGMANSRLWTGASTTGPDGDPVGLNCWTVDAAGVDVDLGVGSKIGIPTGVDFGVGVCFGDSSTIEVEVDVARGVGVGAGVAVGVGVGVRVGFGVGITVGSIAGVPNGVGFAVGIGDGVATSFTGFAFVSAGAGDCSLGSGLGLRFEGSPGSSQPLAISPFANVACNLVLPWTLITVPSNFPFTILPV
jgi:hypothetical protein